VPEPGVIILLEFLHGRPNRVVKVLLPLAAALRSITRYVLFYHAASRRALGPTSSAALWG